MTVAVLAAVLGLATVLVALYRDSTVLSAAQVPRPDWDPLPSLTDIVRTEYPLAVPGYEPAVVDTAIDTLAHAYADLLAEAPPEVRLRAHRRAAVRLGVDPGALPPHLGSGLPAESTAQLEAAAAGDPLEPLRAAAALATLDRRARVAARRRDGGRATDGTSPDDDRGDAQATEHPTGDAEREFADGQAAEAASTEQA